MDARPVGSRAHLIKSYEIALLVRLTAALSEILNRGYVAAVAHLESRSIAVPAFVRDQRFTLRFLAAYPNLAFLALLYALSRIAWSLLF